eukprot:CAMPEP_0204292314 /NCGR_PEP_ID=MMETSP0468-20130131/64110_1 /ASSEMBLY_ACC=CAM_ASM_000383 /TAXON_ID=2969 /ORGANISM="Oxyrrhis marina" /LENGTH=42 /DNA_ID= /DNA_START= /DNA_END= /DNA_ORIENTATION=
MATQMKPKKTINPGSQFRSDPGAAPLAKELRNQGRGGTGVYW